MLRRLIFVGLGLVVLAYVGGVAFFGWRAVMRLLSSFEQAGAGPALSGAPMEPLPTRSKITQGDDQRLVEAWAERVWLAAYRRVGRRNARWDAAAESFIRESLPGFAGLAPAGTRALVGHARELTASGCDDPLIQALAGRAFFSNDGASLETYEMFKRAVAGMQETAYPRAIAWLAALGLHENLDATQEGVGQRQTLAPLELRWFVESLADDSYQPDDDVVLTRLLSSSAGAEMFDRDREAIVAALERTAWVDPWVRDLFSGKRHTSNAWAARGSEYADKVTEAGWKGMSESLGRARQALVASWQARPDRPEAAASMIGVVRAAPATGETTRLWFDRSVSAQFDYARAYVGIIDALRRRWSGDPSALAAFARECYETRRFDTDVPLYAFHALEQMDEDIADEAGAHKPPSIYRNTDTYLLAAAVFDGYLQDPTRTLEYQRFGALYAALNYKAGRYTDARSRLRFADGKLSKEASDTLADNLPAARIEAYGGSRGVDVVRAEERYQAGRLDEALQLLRSALGETSAEGRVFLNHRIATIEIERGLAAGRTVAFLPAPDLAGWSSLVGRWSVAPDGTLEVTSGAQGMLINCDARVGPNFEIEGDIEIVSTTNGQYQAGITFGHPEFSSNDWSSFRIKNTSHEGEVAYFSRHVYAPQRSVRMPIPKRSHVVVQAWNGHLWAYVNGVVAASDYVPEWDVTKDSDAVVGFGAYHDDNTVVVRYREVKLRRLTEAPRRPSWSPPADGGSAR